jgi:benzodiazapine receptor
MNRRSLAALTIFAAAPALAAVAGAVSNRRSVGRWYGKLRKPPFQPPKWLFAPVWTALYGAMAISAHRVWKRPDSPARSRALQLWWGQLALNAAWSPIFFGLRRPRAALADMALLLPAVGGYLIEARRSDPTAAWLMAPYFAWTTFAAVLNAEIVRRN